MCPCRLLAVRRKHWFSHIFIKWCVRAWGGKLFIATYRQNGFWNEFAYVLISWFSSFWFDITSEIIAQSIKISTSNTNFEFRRSLCFQTLATACLKIWVNGLVFFDFFFATLSPPPPPKKRATLCPKLSSEHSKTGDSWYNSESRRSSFEIVECVEFKTNI